MQFVRPLDDTKGFDTGNLGHRAQLMSCLESALFYAVTVQAGGCAGGLHYHRTDQLYYLFRGNMVIRLGDDVHRIAASTFVYIPAGLAHCSWNEGPGPETHLEALIPATPPGAPIAFAVGSPNDVPPDQQAQQPATVVVDVGLSAEPTPRTSLIKLANPEMGIGRTVVNYADVAPGQGDLHTHVREVDEYYFVLEGQLTVDVGLHHHVVGPETLVVIPAGVPHRQYNEGPLVVKHLAILAPVPLDGEPWDREVHFGTNAL